jgi:hypothetical protein
MWRFCRKKVRKVSISANFFGDSGAFIPGIFGEVLGNFLKKIVGHVAGPLGRFFAPSKLQKLAQKNVAPIAILNYYL